MGKLPIIIRRGIRDSEREKAAASTLLCGATGTACASAPATSSAATGSAATGRTVVTTLVRNNVLAGTVTNNSVIARTLRIDKNDADNTATNIPDTLARNVTDDYTLVRRVSTNNASLEKPAINLAVRSASSNHSVTRNFAANPGNTATNNVPASRVIIDSANVVSTTSNNTDTDSTFCIDKCCLAKTSRVQHFPPQSHRDGKVPRKRVRSLPPLLRKDNHALTARRDSSDDLFTEITNCRVPDVDTLESNDLRAANLRSNVTCTNSIPPFSISTDTNLSDIRDLPNSDDVPWKFYYDDDLRIRQPDICRISNSESVSSESLPSTETTDTVKYDRANGTFENVASADGSPKKVATKETSSIRRIIDNTSVTNHHHQRNYTRTVERASSWFPRSHALSFLFGLLAMNMLCIAVLGVPTGSQDSVQASSMRAERSINYQEDTFEDTYENDISPKSFASQRNYLSEYELETIRRSLVQGLGLQRIPDPAKANVSQAEYERAHREYLRKVELSHEGQELRERKNLHIFHATDFPGNETRGATGIYEAEQHRHTLYFPVEIPDGDSWVDHASLRLLLDGDPWKEGPVDVLIYIKTSDSRRLLVRETINLENSHHARWIEFDSTEAASNWHDDGHENLGMEIEFFRKGAPTERSILFPVLNIFTSTDVNVRHRRAVPEHLLSRHRVRRTECREDNKKCCRHEMTVIFKDLKGFDFIVQPKTFDAGYCKGRCPPRYNPAHHHALLQSLIWKEDRRKAPRPCCAPSKLTELEILYFDENDASKLKVSNWKNMRVVECACS